MGERPGIRKKLEPKVWPDGPTQGWKERGAEAPPEYVRKAFQLGIQRLRDRGFFDK